MHKEKEALRLLHKVGAVIADSHIVYTSGRHGSAYVNKDAVYPHTTSVAWLGWAIASEFLEDSVEVVVAPAIGGVILSQWTGYHLTKMFDNPLMDRREVLVTYAEKDGEGFVIKRGYDKLVPGKNVLVVEDVLTTGGSAKKVIEVVRALGGNVVGLGVLCNRGGITELLADVPKLRALVNIALESWPEEECPLCKEGIPVNTDVGKGREFLARMNAV